MKLFTIFLLALFTASGICAADGTITIFQTTDIHGGMGVCDTKPGIARLGKIIENFRMISSNANPPFILIDCGDLTQGSFPATLNHGKEMVDALNTLDYDVWVPGNHDFDFGADELKKRIAQFKGGVVSANLRFTDEKIQPHKKWVLITKNGIKTAVIGITPPYLDQWVGAAQLKGVETLDAVQSIRSIMPEVMNAKPDVTVLAIHLGEFISGRLNDDGKTRAMASISAEFPQIDLILGGHTHQNAAGKHLGAKGAWFVQAPPLSEGLAVIHVTLLKGEKEIHFTA